MPALASSFLSASAASVSGGQDEKRGDRTRTGSEPTSCTESLPPLDFTQPANKGECREGLEILMRPQNRINQVWVLIQLVVQDRIERLESEYERQLNTTYPNRHDLQVVHQPRMPLIRQEEVGRGEGLEQLQEPRGGLDTDILEIRCGIGDTDGQSREEGVESGSRSDRVDRLEM